MTMIKVGQPTPSATFDHADHACFTNRQPQTASKLRLQTALANCLTSIRARPFTTTDLIHWRSVFATSEMPLLSFFNLLDEGLSPQRSASEDR